MSYPEQRALLAQIAQELYGRHRDHLEALKEDGKRLIQRPDFLWHRLVKAYAIWGGVGGWDRLTADPDNLARLAYEALSQLPAAERNGEIREAFKHAGIRWPDRKADLFAGCYDHIEAMGGLEEARRLLLAQKATEGKLRFLKSLPGIGDKNARNMMMGAYHEDFRETIAVDARIQSISDYLELEFGDYNEAERFYQGVARDAGISGWELDRLMFNYTDEFLKALEAPEKSGPQRPLGPEGTGPPEQESPVGARPRYSRQELWQRIQNLWGRGCVWMSLVAHKGYRATDLDETQRRCEFEYESGTRKWIPLDDLYAVYAELYRRERLSRAYLKDPDNSQRVVGRRYWHAPGAAIFGLLPVLDDRIGSSDGELFVKPSPSTQHPTRDSEFSVRPQRGKRDLPPEEFERRLQRRLRAQEEALEQAIYGLARLYSTTGRQGAGISLIRRLIPFLEDREKLARAYLSLGQLMEQLGDYASALQLYSQGLSLEPTSKLFRYLLNNNLGYCLNLEGQPEQAEEHCRVAIAIDPSRYSAHKNLGRSLEQQGQLLAAAHQYVEATKLSASDRRALDHLEDLVTEHPKLVEEYPGLSDQMEDCRQAVDSARQLRGDGRRSRE